MAKKLSEQEELEAKRARCRQMLEQGVDQVVISNTLGVSRSTVAEWARDRTRERDAAERAAAEAEYQRIREEKRADQEKRARALIQEGLPASTIVSRTGLARRAVKALAKEMGRKLPTEHSWL